MKIVYAIIGLLRVALLLLLIVPLCLIGTVLVAVVTGGIAAFIGVACTGAVVLVIATGITVDRIEKMVEKVRE
jgi:hypothetical protein